MLGLLLLILKIIGILLLALIALVLVLILVILLVPVRYRARGSCYGRPEGRMRITWLFHLISVRISYQEKLEVTVRILGFRLFKEKGKKAKEDLIEEPVLSAQEFAEDAADTMTGDDPVTRAGNGPEADSAGEDGPEFGEENDLKTGKVDEEDEPEAGKDLYLRNDGDVSQEDESFDVMTPKLIEKKKKKKQKKNRLLKLFKRIKERIRRLKFSLSLLFNRIKVLWLKKEKLMAFLHDEENRKTFRLLKKQFKVFVRHVRPVKLRGELTFGFEDPYLCGQVLSGAAVFYPMYHKSLKLTPVFQEKILEGKLFLRGRIRLGTLLVIGLRLLIHKNFRVLLKRFLSQGGN